MSALRLLAFIGALILVAMVDGIISGTIASFWGDLNGCRFGDVVSGAIAVCAVWDWTGRLKG